MNKNKLVVGIGELLWDILPDRKTLGGAPANFAYHLSRLGLSSLIISAVGEDDLAGETIVELDKKNIKHLIQRETYPTGTVQVTLDENGIPQYLISEPVAWDFIVRDRDFSKISKRTSAVCFGSLAQRSNISAQSIKEFVTMVDQDAYKVFDINLRQQYYSKDLIIDSLEMCNIFKTNDQELLLLAKMFSLSGSQTEQCKVLIKTYKLKLVVLTCGAEGSYLISGETISFMETPLVKVADTIGAGDAFTAAIIYGLLTGHSHIETHKLAVRLSAFVCSKPGAMPEYTNEF